MNPNENQGKLRGMLWAATRLENIPYTILASLAAVSLVSRLILILR
jgi:hypothetical protein